MRLDSGHQYTGELIGKLIQLFGDLHQNREGELPTSTTSRKVALAIAGQWTSFRVIRFSTSYKIGDCKHRRRRHSKCFLCKSAKRA